MKLFLIMLVTIVPSSCQIKLVYNSTVQPPENTIGNLIGILNLRNKLLNDFRQSRKYIKSLEVRRNDTPKDITSFGKSWVKAEVKEIEVPRPV